MKRLGLVLILCLLIIPLSAQAEWVLPILTYHRIIVNGPSYIDVTPTEFRKHLEYLSQNGYESVLVRDLLAFMEEGTPLPPKPVMLTFDDNYKVCITEALPLLTEFGYKAVFFVNTGSIGSSSAHMTWEDLRYLEELGHEVESHTVSHSNLAELGDGVTRPVFRERLYNELAMSKHVLEEGLGRPVRSFAYPFGSYDRMVEEVTKELYDLAFLIEEGSESSDFHPMRIKRHMMYASDNLKTVIRRIESRPLALSETFPAHADRITSIPREFKAVIETPVDFHPRSIQVQHNLAAAPAKYDPVTRTVTVIRPTELSRGFHNIYITLTDRDGNVYKGGWSFFVTNAQAWDPFH